ncbi:MAG: hypothetical protein KC445_05330, partial [Anaerolineales bacterium]|nr:hypothetical protein [Anaerolineales bacterium]
DIESHFMATIEQMPTLAEQVRAGERVEKFYGTADLHNFFRQPYGPGWALVGDAGHHKDPFMALGIADALRDADLVSQAVHEGLVGKRPFADALAEFEQKRNETSLPLYQENLARATFTPPPPEQRQIRQALVGNSNQADTNAFYKAILGLAAPETFFSPDNIGRIVQQAAQQPAAVLS